MEVHVRRIRCAGVRTVAEVVAEMATRTRPENAAEWDPVGLQLGDPRAEVSTVGVCHEVTEAVVSALETTPVDLLVSYHPLLFAPTRRVVAGRSAEARAFRLIRAGVALLVAHTDWDAASGGAADSLAAALGLAEVRSFGVDEYGVAIGRVGKLTGTLAVVDARVSDRFGASGLRIHGDRRQAITSVAVVPGSGASFIEAAAEVAEVLVTGDVSHHRAARALDLGLSIVDPGHTATERPGIAALYELAASIDGVEAVDLTELDPKTWT